jgi:hypothetical protein
VENYARRNGIPSDSSIHESDSRSLLKKTQSLARMIDLGQEARELWEPGELGTILEHQLAAPLEFKSVGVDQARLREIRAECQAPDEIETFGDLLFHPQPPVALLDLAKQFAKAGCGHPESPLPDEVAAVLYVACIVVAQTKCGRRITRLGDEGIQYGLDRALRQTWLDESIRNLLEEGRQRLFARGPKPG